MKLIDADALEKAIYKWMPKYEGTWMDGWISPIENLMILLMMTIQEQPTVDAEPVRHGKWILEQEEYDSYGYGNWNRWRCSCCGYIRTKGWAATSEGHKPKAMLCEKCGAKMDGGGNNETN